MEEINLKRLFEVAFSLKWLIIVIMILCAFAGYMYSYKYVVPVYNSSIKLVLSQVQDSNPQENESKEESITQSDILINNQLVETYSEIIKSKNVTKKVIENLQLSINEETLSEKIQVSYVDGTQVLKITVTDENPEVSKNIATEVGKVFKEEIKSIYNINNVTVIEEAEANYVPANVNHVRDIIIFEAIGAFISIIIVMIFCLFDTTIKDEKDIENEMGVTSLGMIPFYKEGVNGERKELLSFEDSKSPITECFRTLRTNLVFARNNNNLKNILVLSSFSSEGKSYITANLAMSFAKTNRRVIIIDADMRKGRQHKIFNVRNSRGLSNCLANIAEMDSTNINQIAKYVKNTNFPNIHLITSGTRPANPLELISSDRMIELIGILDKIYDYVIIDGTPTNIVSDSIALSKYVDATVMVAEYKKTKIESVVKVKKAIENVGGNITGIILNKCPITEKAYTEKYYYVEGTGNEDSNKKHNESIEFKSFYDLIKDVDFEKENSYEEEFIPERDEIFEPGRLDNSNYVDYRLDNISSEISSLKDAMLKLAMSINENQSSSYRKEIEDLKNEIQTLKEK